MPNSCIVCGKKSSWQHRVSLHRFPADLTMQQTRLNVLNLSESDLTPNSRICSLHFRDGDITTTPSLSTGEKFGSPPIDSKRAKRFRKRWAKRKEVLVPTTKTQMKSTFDSASESAELHPTLPLPVASESAELPPTLPLPTTSSVEVTAEPDVLVTLRLMNVLVKVVI